MNKNIVFPSAIILAAGLSERMGENKAILPFNKTSNFVENIANSMIEAGCEKIIVVINSVSFEIINRNILFKNSKILIAVNDMPELGRFRSLKIGLKMLKEKNVFVHNCDNPFCKPSLLKDLFVLLDEKNYVVPIYKNKGGHPILLSNYICKNLVNINEDNANLKKILLNFNKKELMTTDNKILFNINTPEDYNVFIRNNNI